MLLALCSAGGLPPPGEGAPSSMERGRPPADGRAPCTELGLGRAGYPAGFDYNFQSHGETILVIVRQY